MAEPVSKTSIVLNVPPGTTPEERSHALEMIEETYPRLRHNPNFQADLYHLDQGKTFLVIGRGPNYGALRCLRVISDYGSDSTWMARNFADKLKYLERIKSEHRTSGVGLKYLRESLKGRDRQNHVAAYDTLTELKEKLAQATNKLFVTQGFYIGATNRNDIWFNLDSTLEEIPVNLPIFKEEDLALIVQALNESWDALEAYREQYPTVALGFGDFYGDLGTYNLEKKVLQACYFLFFVMLHAQAEKKPWPNEILRSYQDLIVKLKQYKDEDKLTRPLGRITGIDSDGLFNQFTLAAGYQDNPQRGKELVTFYRDLATNVIFNDDMERSRVIEKLNKVLAALEYRQRDKEEDREEFED